MKILESTDYHSKAAKIAVEEGRVLLTCGQPYEQMKKLVPNGMCYRVANNASAYEQMQMILLRYNVIVTNDDLFTRCPKCNCDTFEHYQSQQIVDMHKNGNAKTKKKIAIKFDFGVSVTEKVNEFLVCADCGHVFWEGCHHSRWKEKIKDILLNVKS